MKTNSPALPLVVSIHDVRPGLIDSVTRMLEILKNHGVAKTSLLVIPNFHHQEPLAEQPKILQKIRDWQTQGHELMQHALYHREDRPTKQTAWQYLVSRHYTNGEGEFYRLNKSTAQQRLQNGKKLFADWQFNSPGFTAPAWLYSQESIEAIADCGFAYFTTLLGVQPINRPFISARAIVWSHRAAWRRFTSNLILPIIATRLMLMKRPLRIALHPPDFDYPAIQSSALKIIERALQRGYQPTTYMQLVEQSGISTSLASAAEVHHKPATPLGSPHANRALE